MARWHDVNAYQMLLHWLRITGDAARVSSTLDTLGEAIKACSKRIGEAQKTGDEQWVDIVTDEECSMVEDLVGTAFVVCQTYITGVISRIAGLHRYHESQDAKNPLLTTSGKKHKPQGVSPSILKYSSPTIGKSGHTAVELIDAFANYFKHHDEWFGSWSKLKEPSASTAKAVMAAGGSRGSSGNLRTGAERLGNSDYSDLDVFTKHLTKWTNNLLDGYAKELHKRELISSAGLKSMRHVRG